MYPQCFSLHQALKHFLRVTDDQSDAAVTMAIETVGQAQDEQLTRLLIDFLMGENDGVPKVFFIIYLIYLAMSC